MSKWVRESLETSALVLTIGSIRSTSCSNQNTGAHSTKGTSEPSAARSGTPPKKVRAAKRLKWSNEMVAELVRLRFADGDVKRRLEAAQTKTQTALAWQYFASVLSQSLGVVINRDQVSQKYRKLKCIYRKEKREEGKTGNCARSLREIDDGLWSILHDAFSGKVGISGEVLLDSHLDGGESDSSVVDHDSGDADRPPADAPGKGKLSPIESLATSMRSGMEAIAASLSARTSPDDGLGSLAATLERHHEETRRFQAIQLQLLQQLLARKNA